MVELDYKSRLILLFILVAIIPILALSAVSAYTVLKFKDQFSNMYFVVVSNQGTLQKASHELDSTRSSLLQYMGSENVNQQTAAVSDLETNLSAFPKTFESYRNFSSFQDKDLLLSSSTQNKNIDQIILNEQRLQSQITSESNEYRSKIRDLIILSKDPNFKQVRINNAAQALAFYDDLEDSFQQLITINSDIAKITYETSNNVVQLAYLYLGIASSISAASATAAAILVSKRVILGDLVRRTKIELVQTTVKDLLGEGSDLILRALMKELPQEKEKES